MIRLMVATARPLSSAAGKPCSAAMVGPQAIAVPCPPTNDIEPTTTPAAFGRPSAIAPRVPTVSCKKHEDHSHQAEHAEDTASGGQVPKSRVHPDRREEDDEQLVPCGHVERDVDAEQGVHRPEDERGDKAAGHRLRNAVAPQKLDALGDEHSDKEDHDADRNREEIGRYEVARVRRHGDVPCLDPPECTLGRSPWPADKTLLGVYTSTVPDGQRPCHCRGKSERTGSHNMVQGEHAFSARSRAGGAAAHGQLGASMAARSWGQGDQPVRDRCGSRGVEPDARFAALRRQRTQPRLSTFVVEQALAGRAGRIKAYTIATEVFGRDPKFDPQLDSIVRIEAGRSAVDRALLPDGRPNEPRPDRHPARRLRSGLRLRRAGIRPGHDRLAARAGNRLRGGGRPVLLPHLHPRLHAVADHRAHPLHRAPRLRRGDRAAPSG